MNIEIIDLFHQGVPETIAAFLIDAPDGPVLIETGPEATLPALVRGLATHGVRPADVRHLLVTHIHFDHAGAAGWWAQQGTQVYVHPIGAPHLIDPRRLIRSATRIYQERMATLWGDIRPAPAERVTAVVPDRPFTVAGLTIMPLPTPGHASHHFVYEIGNVAFTGDAAGIRLPSRRLVMAPCPPPEFDLELWLATLDKLTQRPYEAIYPTHFGRVDVVADQLATMQQLLPVAAAVIRDGLAAGLDEAALNDAYEVWNGERATALGLTPEDWHQYVTANPLNMSVNGISRYWRKQAAASA